MYTIRENTLISIANAIRNKSNYSGRITPIDMPNIIESIPTNIGNIFKSDTIPSNGQGNEKDLCFVRDLSSYDSSGLGWYAPKGKILMAEGALIETLGNNIRKYYTYTSGPAIAVEICSTSNNQYNTAPLILSTNPEYVSFTTSQDSTIHYYRQNMVTPYIEYLNFNWYYNLNYAFKESYKATAGIVTLSERIDVSYNKPIISTNPDSALSALEIKELIINALNKVGVVNSDNIRGKLYQKNNGFWEMI